MKTSVRSRAKYAAFLKNVEELPTAHAMATEMTDAYGSQLKVAQVSGIAQNTFHRIYKGTRTNLKVHIYMLLLKAFLRLKSAQSQDANC